VSTAVSHLMPRLRRQRCQAVSACLVMWLCACSADDASLSDASAAFAVHRESFVRFDRWARQLQSSDVALRSRAALAEATFAPLRSQSSVLAARVTVLRSEDEPSTSAERMLELPEGSSWPTIDAKSVRDPALGSIHVAWLRQCGFGRASLARADEPCIVVLRQAPLPAGATLEVRVAYRDERDRTAAP
jgi:hypothetical protein